MKRFIKNDEINGKSAKTFLNLDVKHKEIHLSLEKMKFVQKLTDWWIFYVLIIKRRRERENAPILRSNSEVASKKYFPWKMLCFSIQFACIRVQRHKQIVLKWLSSWLKWCLILFLKRKSRMRGDFIWLNLRESCLLLKRPKG